MSDPDSINRDKNENVKEDDKEEEKVITTQPLNDDSNNQSKKVRAITTDDGNQNYVSMISISNIQNKLIHKNVHTKILNQRRHFCLVFSLYERILIRCYLVFVNITSY